MIIYCDQLVYFFVGQKDPFLLMNLRNVLHDGKGSRFTEEGTAWIDSWNGPETVFFGHDAVRGIQIKKNDSGTIIAVGLDTGACYGNKLSAYVLPEGKIVQQQSAKIYEKPNIPLATEQPILP